MAQRNNNILERQNAKETVTMATKILQLVKINNNREITESVSNWINS